MIKKIILTPQTHTDIGYTELPHKVMAMHVRYLRQAMDLCENTRNFPDGEGYKWTVESMVVVREFLKVACEEEQKRFFNLVRSKHIEITGFYTQSQTQLLSVQELDEELKFARELASRENLPISTMVLDDIGGLSWNLPQFMNRAGIKNYVMGVGGWRVLTPVCDLPHLFRYYGVDGKSCLIYLLGLGKNGDPRQVKFLLAQYGFGVIYVIFPYRQTPIGGDFAHATKNVMAGDQALFNLVKRIEDEGYPFDTLMLQTGSDNAGPYVDIPEIVKNWNSRYNNLILSIGTPNEFFDYIENRYGYDIPELSGEITCSWSEHVLTQGRGTGEVREAGRILAQADILSPNAPFTPGQLEYFYNQRKMVLENICLFKDHTFGLEAWGFRKAMSANHRLHTGGVISDYARKSWNIKQNYALTAKMNAENMLHLIEQSVILNNDKPIDTSTKFCSPHAPDPEVTLVNTLPYPRSGLLRFHGENLGDIKLQIEDEFFDADRETSSNCGSDYSILIENMSANGYIHARILTEQKEMEKFIPPFAIANSPTALTITWSNAKLVIDPHSGNISSYQVNGLEIQDSSEGYHLNDFIQYQVNGVSQVARDIGLTENVSYIPGCQSNGAVSVNFVGRYSMKIQLLRLYNQGEKSIRVESEIELIKDNPNLFLRNRVRKIHALEHEAGYFIFPVKVDSQTWELKTHQQGYIHDFLTEKLPGAAHRNFAFQDFAVIGDQRQGAMISSKHCTMMSIGNSPKYYNDQLKYVRDAKPHIFMQCYNNLWVTNTAQEQINGDMYFDFVVQALPDGLPVEVAEMQVDNKINLHPICSISTRWENVQAYLQINSKVIDYYFSAGPNDAIEFLNLVNLSRKKVNSSIVLAGKTMAVTFAGAEAKIIKLIN